MATDSSSSSTAGQVTMNNVAQMLAYFHTKHGLHEGMEYFLSLLYRVGLYEQYAQLFGSVCAEAKSSGSNPIQFSANAYLLLAASYLKSGYFNEAISISELMLKDPPKPSDIEESIRWRGMQISLQLIRNMAMHPELIPEDDDFDPLMFEIRTSTNDENQTNIFIAKTAGMEIHAVCALRASSIRISTSLIRFILSRF